MNFEQSAPVATTHQRFILIWKYCGTFKGRYLRILRTPLQKITCWQFQPKLASQRGTLQQIQVFVGRGPTSMHCNTNVVLTPSVLGVLRVLLSIFRGILGMWENDLPVFGVRVWLC